MSKNKIEPTEPIEPIELKLDFSLFLLFYKIQIICLSGENNPDYDFGGY